MSAVCVGVAPSRRRPSNSGLSGLGFVNGALKITGELLKDRVPEKIKSVPKQRRRHQIDAATGDFADKACQLRVMEPVFQSGRHQAVNFAPCNDQVGHDGLEFHFHRTDRKANLLSLW